MKTELELLREFETEINVARNEDVGTDSCAFSPFVKSVVNAVQKLHKARLKLETEINPPYLIIDVASYNMKEELESAAALGFKLVAFSYKNGETNDVGSPIVRLVLERL